MFGFERCGLVAQRTGISWLGERRRSRLPAVGGAGACNEATTICPGSFDFHAVGGTILRTQCFARSFERPSRR